MTVTSKLPSKYRKKQRDRKEKRRPHPLGAQSEARCQETGEQGGMKFREIVVHLELAPIFWTLPC